MEVPDNTCICNIWTGTEWCVYCLCAEGYVAKQNTPISGTEERRISCNTRDKEDSSAMASSVSRFHRDKSNPPDITVIQAQTIWLCVKKGKDMQLIKAHL